MKITIYQIIPELDRDRLLFMPLSYFQKAGYPSPPAEIYESVFCGETEVTTLEEIYRTFLTAKMKRMPAIWKDRFSPDIPCRSLTFWKYRTRRESRFYFCDTFGFPQIAFQKENAILPVKTMIISL